MNSRICNANHQNRKSFRFLTSVFIFFCFLFFGNINIQAQDPKIIVCNEGTIPIYVTKLNVSSSFFGTYNWLQGWMKVEPSSRSLFQQCGVFEAEGTTHLVFGMFNKDDEFGVVKYEFTNSCLDCNFKQKEICVKNDNMDYNSSSLTFLPPCPSGFTAVPTSHSVYAQGNAKLTLTVKPTSNDDISVYLSPRKQPPTPIKPTPPTKLVEINSGIPNSKIIPGKGLGIIALNAKRSLIETKLGKGTVTEKYVGYYEVSYHRKGIFIFYGDKNEAKFIFFNNKGYSYENFDIPNVTTDKGVTWSSKPDEILKLYGSTDRDLTYSSDGKKRTIEYKGISFNFESDELKQIVIKK